MSLLKLLFFLFLGYVLKKVIDSYIAIKTIKRNIEEQARATSNKQPQNNTDTFEAEYKVKE